VVRRVDDYWLNAEVDGKRRQKLVSGDPSGFPMNVVARVINVVELGAWTDGQIDGSQHW